MAKGFLLDVRARAEAGRMRVELWGRLEDGASFLVRDRRAAPYFFLAGRDVEAARRLGMAAGRCAPAGLRDLDGEPLARIDLATTAEQAALRERLRSGGLPTFESDLRFTSRYLVDLGIRGALEIEGPWRPGSGVARVWEDPALSPASWAPELSCLALDIETDPTASRVLSFALHGAGAREVHLLAPPGPLRLPEWAHAHPDERALLAAFEARLRALDPDVVTGWNVVGFDLAVLERRASQLRPRLRPGRGPDPLAVRIDSSFWSAARAEIHGRAVLDGVDLLRGAFYQVEDHRLETVARSVLGEGKLLHGAGRAEEIERLHREDPLAFCEYNLRDAELVTRILEKTGLVRLAVKRSLLTGMPLDRVGASIASFDALYLPELRRRGHVAPDVSRAAGSESGITAGGAVLEPVPGLHERVIAFDFKSLYPSLMRTFNIDPLTHVRGEEAPPDAILTPAGERFRREPGILPGILARLLAVREAARAEGDAIAAQATKILMNSFYGVLAAPACRFHSTRIANAITGTGQALLYWTKARAEALGHPVLYGDTDSLFVRSGAATDAGAHELGRELARRLTADLAAHLAAAHGVTSRLELELDAVYLKLFFPHMRHGPGGARKRYAGLVEEGGTRKVVFVGLESVRRDWTAAAKQFQRGLYERLFAGQPVAGFVREFLRALRAGEHDAGLVYKKALRKELSAYTATTPPHVKAARLAEGGGRLVEYVMTTAGPEPIGARGHPIDHAHYVDRQLRPIAEAVLPAFGLEWEEVALEPRQLRLF